MYGKYKDLVLSNFAGGLNSRFDSNQIDDSESPDLQNVVFDGRNSFGPRKGLQVFGTSSTSAGAIYNTYGFADREGTEHILRTVTSSLEYYNTQTSAFEVLRNDYTPGIKFGFAYYGSASLDDFLYINNGINKPWAWHPRYSQVSGQVSATDTVIYLSTGGTALSALGWLSAGSFILTNGEEGYYASLSANALSSITRVSNPANTVATQTAIAQLPLSSYRFTYQGATNTYSLSAMPKGNILKLFQARMFVTGVSTAEETVQYSKIDNPWDFTYNSVTSAGDGGVVSFSEGGGDVTALGSKNDTLLVYKQNLVRGLRFTDSDLPVPMTVIDGVNLGAINSKSLSPIESDLVWASPLGVVRQLSQDQAAETFAVNQVSEKIAPTLQQLNLASAAATYYDSKWYLACATSGSNINDTVMVYDYIYKAWTRFKGVNVNDWFIYNDQLCYGSSNEMATYTLLQDYDDNDFGYDVYWNSKKLDYNMPHELKRLRYVYVEGEMTTNTVLSASLYYNGDNSPVTKVIYGTGDYVDLTDSSEIIGRSTFGQGTLGGVKSYSTYNLYKFRVRLSYDNVDFFNMQLKFRCTSPGMVWKINYIGPYVENLPGKKFPTASII